MAKAKGKGKGIPKKKVVESGEEELFNDLLDLDADGNPKKKEDDDSDIADFDDGTLDENSDREPIADEGPEPAPISSVSKKVRAMKDCRLCVNYPMSGIKTRTTSLSEDLLRVTDNFTKSFCGERPCDKEQFKNVSRDIDCKGKTFQPMKDVR